MLLYLCCASGSKSGWPWAIRATTSSCVRGCRPNRRAPCRGCRCGVEYVRDGDSAGVRNLREEPVERVGELQLSFLDELKDHHGGIRLCDRGDPVFRLRGQRFLFGPVDLAVAEGAVVKDVAVLGEGQAAHPLVLFEEPVKKLVEFGFVKRLRVARGNQHQCQKSCEESCFHRLKLYSESLCIVK